MTWTADLPQGKHDKLMAALDEHGREHLKYAGDDRDFAAFLLVADTAARMKNGLSIFDLPDYSWRDVYDDGMTPGEALRSALDNGI
jgi:hypothetical protein